MERGGGWSSGLILAAGGSSRMGSPKQLLPVHGRPMLEFVVAQACASQLDDVVVVLGGHAALIKERVDFGRGRPIVNRDFRSGMSSSLRLGLGSLARETGRTVIILGDQPGTSSACSTSSWTCSAPAACPPPPSASTGSSIRRWSSSGRSGRSWSRSRATSASGR